MENLENKTPTELLKMVNDIKAEHENIKFEITKATHEIDELDKFINNKISRILVLEKNYVTIIEEIEKRK